MIATKVIKTFSSIQYIETDAGEKFTQDEKIFHKSFQPE